VAVSLAEMLERERHVRVVDDRTYAVTAGGARWLATALGVDVAPLAARRRALARRCLDWTERRPHLAGALGAAVLDRLVEARWVARTAGSRAVRITARGRDELARLGLAAALADAR